MEQLAERGWRVAVVWECALRKLDIDTVADTVGAWLIDGDQRLEVAWPQTFEG